MMQKAKKNRLFDSATIRKMSTPMETQKRRFIPAYAEQTEPTKERLAKPDYETRGKKRIKLNTVKALHQSGDISGDAVTSSERWISDYIFAHQGYTDALQESLPSDYIKGDVHTFALNRGKAGERISLVRERLGLCGHIRLEMLLVKELSFSIMGEKLFPNLGSTQARTKAAAQCALVLEQLDAFYRDQAKERARQKKLVLVGKN